MTQAHDEVVKAVEAMTNAFQANEIDRVMQAYESRATIAFEPGEPTSDRAEQEQLFRDLAALEPRYAYAGHSVMVQDELALHIAPWHLRANAPDGSSIEQRGLSVAVLRRDAAGGWRIVLDDPHGQRLMG